MKAIINGRIVLPNKILTGKALVYDEKIRAIVDPSEIRKYLIGAVEVLFSKREALPSRKHASI